MDATTRTSRRDMLIGGAVGAGGLTAAALLGPAAALASAVATFNVTDSPYNAAGDGVTNDTTAVQDAIDAAGLAGGGIVVFPAGTYLITGGGLTGADNVTLLGVGGEGSVLKSGSASGGATILDVSWQTGMTIDGIEFDGDDDDSGLEHGIYASAYQGPVNDLRVQNCRFVNFANEDGHTIYIWPTSGVWIDSSDFLDCVNPIFLDDPSGPSFVTNNSISAPNYDSAPGRMVWGIRLNAGDPVKAPALIAGNSVSDAVNDPGNGTGGHGISLYNAEGARVEGNTLSNCQTAGILIGANSYGSVAVGNVARDNHGTGIYVETDGGSTEIGTAGAPRGAVVTGNSCSGNGAGIVASYAAGTQINDNVSHNNVGDGIVVDSDRVVITGNIVYNNWNSGSPAQLVKAGIRNYGSRGIHDSNTCYDNRSSRTQAYGIAIDDDNHIATSNQLAGNLTGGLYQPGGASTNTVANNET